MASIALIMTAPCALGTLSSFEAPQNARYPVEGWAEFKFPLFLGRILLELFTCPLEASEMVPLRFHLQQ